jgi:glycosyltransferase involved in cell wall biosynthesis
MLKVLHINTNDLEGGAARASYRLHRGLQDIGITSEMLVQRQTSDDLSVISPATAMEKAIAKMRPTLDRLPCFLYADRQKSFYSIQWFPDRLASRVNFLAPDIINLHWINAGFLQIETLTRFSQPVVWTLHDMWAFTGGCHYSGECDRYTHSCGACPQLGSIRERDLSRLVWQRKARSWKDLALTIVTPSRWLAEQSQKSSLLQNFRVEVIPNGIDIRRYKPLDRNLAREILGLPQDKQIVLFGAMSPTGEHRKGFHLFLPALQRLSQSESWQGRLELAILGTSRSPDSPDFNFKAHYLGRLGDDISLALVYAAADVFVAPSLQDNLPNTVLEALACGTPCVTFNIGGMPDMIDHKKNGYLVEPFNIEEFAHGIAWVLEDRERSEKLQESSRQKVVEKFTLELQANRYLALYEELFSHDG